MKRIFCLVLIAASTTFAQIPDPGAVVVFSEDQVYYSGQALASGGWVESDDGETVLLLKTGSMVKVREGSRYHIPRGMKPEAWFFDTALNALVSFDSKWNNFRKELDEMFRGVAIQAVPDTVEDRLIYPVGATVIEIPEALKWNLENKPVAVSLWELQSGEKIVDMSTTEDSLLRAQYADKLKPGTTYLWQVTGAEAADTSWFRLLPEEQLLELSDQLSVFERVETLGKRPDIAFGWLMIRVSVLAQRRLYYEARAQIRKFREDHPGDDPRVDELMYRVRMIQRYGMPPEYDETH